MKIRRAISNFDESSARLEVLAAGSQHPRVRRAFHGGPGVGEAQIMGTPAFAGLWRGKRGSFRLRRAVARRASLRGLGHCIALSGEILRGGRLREANFLALQFRHQGAEGGFEFGEAGGGQLGLR